MALAANDNLKKIKARASAANSRKDLWATQTDELFEYVLPYRKPVKARTGSQTEGEGRVNRVFDSTGIKAAQRFAGRMERDVTPPFQRFFELKLGPAFNGDKQAREEIDADLEVVSAKVAALLERSAFSIAASEMYLDLFAGTGCMLILEDEDDIVKFVSVPFYEVALREDGYGKVVGVYWTKDFKADTLEGQWPEDKMQISDALRRLIDDKPDTDVTICQATEYDRRRKKWVFTVYRPDTDEAPIYVTEMDTTPWLTPRFYKVPGEVQGRGPGLMALPTIKTLNKITELSLKAAAFAILGIWTYRQDRVFNPKTARMVPGAMWPVASNGGAYGESVKKMDVPGRFDLTNVIIQDLRMMVKEICLDDTLPADSTAVKSATEIMERMKRLMTDLSGAYGRLALEIHIPLVQRLLSILGRRGLIPDRLKIDQTLLKLEIVSPLARAQNSQDAMSIVQWLQILLEIGGPQMMALSAKVEEIGVVLGEKLGVAKSLMRDPNERQGLLQLVAQMIASSQQQQSAPPEAPPANPQQPGMMAAA